MKTSHLILTLIAAFIIAAPSAIAQNTSTATYSVSVPENSDLEVSTSTATQGTKVTVKYNGSQYVINLKITPLATRVTILDWQQYQYIPIGTEFTLDKEIYPDLPDVDKTVSWSSSDPDVVSVTNDKDGAFKALGGGKATITVTTVTNKTDQITIFVGGKFSVAEGKQVMFAPGNLQYNVDENAQTKWRFAENQWDYIGGTINGSHKGNVPNNTNTNVKGPWIDLFGWGMWLDPGTFSEDNAKYKASIKPTQTSKDNKDYVYYVDNSDNKVTYQGDLNDLGRSAMGSDWVALTKEELCYLFCCNSSDVGNFTNNTRKDKFGWGSIKLSENEKVCGMILLPDGWTSNPDGVSFTSGMSSNNNTYTAEDWEKMEANGAVFLPAAGSRYGTDVIDVGDFGLCWSSSARDENGAWVLYFYSGYVYPGGSSFRYRCHSVRLVRRLE